MLNEEEVLGGGFLDADPSRYLLGTTTSSSINRSLSMPPLYASQLSVDANPWNTDSQFETVPDIGQNNAAGQNAVDDDILGEGLTAASVLVGVDLPEIYDTAYLRARPVGERVSLDSLEKVIGLAELSPRTVQEILNIVVPLGAMYVTHNEFNTAIALVACEQKNMDVSLQTVYQHRNDLPSPILLNLDQLNVKRATAPPAVLKQQQQQQQQLQQRSLNKNQSMDDPWLTVPNGRNNGKLDEVRSAPTSMRRPKLGFNGNGTTSPSRSRSMDNTHQIQQQQPNGSDNNNGNNNNTHHDQLLRPDANGKFLNDNTTMGPTDSYQWFLDLDMVKVAIAPEKEGFIFKHVNYVIESQLRSSKVLRRYSDFYWLWETLLRRYPMRVVPNLPPKKLGGKDESFLEKRRKGLSRFINSIVRHPTLKCDEVVETFLTEPSELLAWRRANPPVVDEEFVRKMPNAAELECCIPQDLDARLESLKNKLPTITDHYNNKCIVLERLNRICEVQSREFVRYSITLNAMSEVEQECYVPGCQSCPQVVRGYEAVAKHMQRAGTILDDQALAATNGVLENLKRHRDLLISFKEMIERKERLEVNQLDSLSKKISANKAKVNQNRGVPGLESEVERLDIAIESDQDKLTYQLNRDTHIQYCVASELSYIHKQQAFISLMYQNYVHEQLQFTRQLGDNWKVLQSLACEMPIDPEEFA
ncbi:hypothetical protein BDA99DRAFT_500821 [Phascolomyces articulosus]|uniref:Sorting nexin MVP1 n=1 Tax=Phascolomyces articulosus TaxID=60185 RepID=A0AAD5KI66_9FUNG|nr:hypothetical protein BDA99DRAFT_500821 [Phascolomyces articulosus]